jgi:hypothetical protein
MSIVRQGEAFTEQGAGEVGDRAHRLGRGLEIAQLRADVALHPGDHEARQEPGLAKDSRRLFDGHAELVLAQAGGDVGMRLGIDVGIHAQRDRGPRPAGSGERRETPQLRLALDVELADPRVETEGQFLVRLPHPREHDVLGLEARARGLFQLTARDDVGARSHGGEDLEQLDRRIGLERIADPVRHRRKCGFVGPIGGLDTFARVDVERGLELAGQSIGALANPRLP